MDVWKDQQKGEEMRQTAREFWRDEAGMGTVEIKYEELQANLSRI
jgi:hypothetical protein